MSTTVTNYHDVVVLSVKDDLAGDAVESFVDRAARAIETGHQQVVVDCTNVKGFDSTGLEALLNLQNQCEEKLGAVKLCGLDDTCGKILDITRLARRFEVFEDLDAAVKSFT